MKSVEFESAQNVKVEYELAPVGYRLLAALIDVVMFILYFLLCAYVVGISNFFSEDPGTTMLIWLIIIKLPWIFYQPICEFLTQGQTLGKFVLGIRVVTIYGERPGFKEVFMRWLFRGDLLWISPSPIVILWLVIGAIGFGFAGFSDKHQRLGDIMGGTLVIRNKSSIQYSLKKILSIKSNTNYNPVYGGVIKLTDEDMFLIKNTIIRVKANPSQETKDFAIELANKSAEIIGLEKTPEKRLKFLETLLQDYVVLTR